jgi:WD40 repeat protein
VAVENKPVELRSVPEGSLLRTFAETEDAPAVAFSLNRTLLLCGGETVRAFDLVTGAGLEKVWPHPHTVIGFGFTASADRFVTVSKDGKARVCSLNSPADASIVATAAHRPSIRIDSCSKKTSYRQDFLEVPVLSLPALGGLDTRLVTRTGPYGISIWETGTGRLLQALDQMCCSCRFVLSPDSTRMAAGLQGGKVGVWDVTTGSQEALLTSSGACILDLTYGPVGEWLLTAQANGVARVWSVPQDRPIYSAMHHATEVDKVAFAPNGEIVATGQADGLIRVWALPKASSRGHLISSTPGPKVMRLDPERCHFVAAREPAWKAELRTATIFNAQTGQPVGPTLEFEGNLEDVALSPKHKMAAVIFGTGGDTQPGMLEFREVHSGKLAGRMQLVCAASSLSWDPKADRVAVITHAGHLLIATPGSNTPVTWAQPVTMVSAEVHPLVAFSPDGASLVSMTPTGTLEVRQSATGSFRYPALRPDRGGYRFFTVSPDSRLLACTTSSGQVDVWNLETGLRQVNSLYHPGQVYRCSFSADSALLATACHDCKSRVWDLQSGHLAGTAIVHPNEVYDVTFTPDGNWVLTACRDGAVRIWERRTGQLIAPRITVGSQAFTVDVTADGNYAVVGSLDDRIHVLSLATLNQPLCGDVDKLCTLAEIVSGSVLSQGMLRDLTTVKWLQRFRDLQRVHGQLAGERWPAGCMVQSSHYVPPERTPPAKPAQAAIGPETSDAACATCTNNVCPRSVGPPKKESSRAQPR